jgi:hypothetical protein
MPTKIIPSPKVVELAVTASHADPDNKYGLNTKRPVELDQPGPVVVTLSSIGSDHIRLRVVTRREMLRPCSTERCQHDAAFRMTIGEEEYALVCVHHAWAYGWFDQ